MKYRLYARHFDCDTPQEIGTLYLPLAEDDSLVNEIMKEMHGVRDCEFSVEEITTHE